MVLKSLLIVAMIVPASAVDPAYNVASWVQGWQNHRALVEPNLSRASGSGFGATGVPGARVVLTMDLSTMDTARVEVASSPCPTSGQTIRCELTLDDYGMKQVYVTFQVVGTPKTGPAGYVTIRAEPLFGIDPDTSDNVSTLDIDLRVDAISRFGVRATDVQGAVGDTVTVPVTITNQGPNTLKGIVLTHPTGGGGKDFIGGDGCVLTPTPQCQVGRIPPDTSKTVNLKFHIRRCFQPTASDPEYGASLNGGVPVDTGAIWFAVDPKKSDQTFRITVRDCVQNFPAGGQSAAVPTASATPSAPPSASPADVPRPGAVQLLPDQTQPPTARTDMSRPVSSGITVLLLIGAGVIALIRLRRRKKGL